MSDPNCDITGVVLAGGRAERMGGCDKGLITLAGRPMIEYVLAALSPQVGRLLINANRSRDAYARYDVPVIADHIGQFSGPLAGIHAALNAADTDLVLTVPCDGPWLPTDLVQRLHRQLMAQQADVCVAHDGNRMQPVFALFHQRVLPDLQAYLEQGDRKLQLWLQRVNLGVVEFTDHPEAFVNVNTPEERARVEAKLKDRN